MKAIIFEPKPNSKRIKFHIPYQATVWRIQVKALDSSFFHYNQKTLEYCQYRGKSAGVKKYY